jgi:hypothetical protein
MDVRNPPLSAVPDVPRNADNDPEVLESDGSSESYVPSVRNSAPSAVQGEDDNVNSSDEDGNQQVGKKPARWCLPVYRDVLLRYFDDYHALPSSERSNFTYSVSKKLRKVAKRENSELPKDLVRVCLLYSLFG